MPYFLFIFLLLTASLSYSDSVEDLNLLKAKFEIGLTAPSYTLPKPNLEILGRDIKKTMDLFDLTGKLDSQTAHQVHEWVALLFEDGRIQEGIWILDNFGFFKTAEEFALRFEEGLKSKTLTTKKYVTDCGVCEPQWGTSGEFPVIIKREDQAWKGAMHAEAWVYHLDRILGLNLVPLTFIGKINGFEYSVQAAIMSAENSGIEFRMTHYTDQYPEIFILDFLTQNRDRHSKNSLISALGTLVAIDNGRTSAVKLHRQDGQMWRTLYPHYSFPHFPKPNLVKTIAEFNLDAFKSEFSKYADSDTVDFVTENLLILKSDFIMMNSPGLVRPLESSQRLLLHFQLRCEDVLFNGGH